MEQNDTKKTKSDIALRTKMRWFLTNIIREQDADSDCYYFIGLLLLLSDIYFYNFTFVDIWDKQYLCADYILLTDLFVVWKLSRKIELKMMQDKSNE